MSTTLRRVVVNREPPVASGWPQVPTRPGQAEPIRLLPLATPETVTPHRFPGAAVPREAVAAVAKPAHRVA